jgi:hypothetical protein
MRYCLLLHQQCLLMIDRQDVSWGGICKGRKYVCPANFHTCYYAYFRFGNVVKLTQLHRVCVTVVAVC